MTFSYVEFELMEGLDTKTRLVMKEEATEVFFCDFFLESFWQIFKKSSRVELSYVERHFYM